MRNLRAMGIAGVLGLAAACGSVKATPPVDAAPRVDAASQPDAGGTTMSTQPKREVVSGGGSVTGGGMRLDVQIGHPVHQGPTTGGGNTLEGGAAVKP